jgi:hypothetical protein
MPKIEQAGVAPQSAFTGLWPVESRYEIVERKVRGKTIPVVVPSDLSKPQLIEPDLFPRIASEFSEIESDNQLLAFNRKFGLLGFARLFPHAVKYGGEPVSWSRGHARRVATAFEVFQLIRRGPLQTRKELPGVLRSIGWDLMGMIERGKLEVSFTQDQDTTVITPGSLSYTEWPSDPLRVAWRVLAHLINDQIRGLRVEVSEGELRPVFVFDALIQVIYWRLVGELEELNLRRCKVCKIFFRAKRVDARHCSSKCRMRHSRENKKIGKNLRRTR